MKKWLCIAFLVILFLIFSVLNFAYNFSSEYVVSDIISPIEFVLDNSKHYKLMSLETFDSNFTEHNKKLAKTLNITENEAFIMGSLGRDWAKNIILNRKIKISKNDLIYFKYGYTTRFTNSPFSIKDGKPTNIKAFEKQLTAVRRGKFVIVNLDDDNILEVSKSNREKVKNFVVIRRSHAKKSFYKQKNQNETNITNFLPKIELKNLKIIVSDHFSKLKPDRNCSTDMCKEILSNINNASETIDIAIYGYSATPEIEKSIKKAIQRGVKVRLVYDLDSKKENIYPDTGKLVKMIPNSQNDITSKECGSIMHNKFYIFDNKTVITGSANLSHTDMSDFNSNAIIVIKSKEVAKYYTQEFEQMFSGKFHNDKIAIPDKNFENLQIFFSPKDKAITNGVLPIIKNAKNYIYIPTFLLTEKRVADELINAKKRGVDVKIIIDALSASNKHSQDEKLRQAGILLKSENWAGKMHSKSIIVDDKYLIIGSMNFSKSGELKNDENIIILKNSQAAKFYKDFFIYQWNKIPDIWLKYTPRAEGYDSVGSCFDGIDNNYDGFIDFDDPACKITTN